MSDDPHYFNDLYYFHGHIRRRIIQKSTSPLRDWLLVFVELVASSDGIIPLGLIDDFAFKLAVLYGDGADIMLGLLVQSGEFDYKDDYIKLNPKYMTDWWMV